MKRIICLVIALTMLISLAFATESKLGFDEFEGEINDKVVNALKVDGKRLFWELYSKQAADSRAKKVTRLRKVTQLGDNYLVLYDCDNMTLDTWIYKTYGDYCIVCRGCGYAVYLTDEDKVISMDEAYEKGVMTESDVGEAVTYYNDLRKDNPKEFYLGAKIGDLNSDNLIDIVDLVSLRQEVISYATYYSSICIWLS